MKTQLFRHYLISGLLATLALFSACKKKEDLKPTEPNFTVIPTPTVPLNPAPTSNTIIVNSVVYTKNQTSSTFDYTGNNIIDYINSKASTKDVEIFVSLPNTNPQTGSYKVIAYGNDFDAIPRGKVSFQLKEYAPNYNTYKSTLDTNTLVKVVNLGDSVEVTYENIRLERTYYSSTDANGAPIYSTATSLVSGKYKIKTKPVPPTYTGSATFTEGSANKVSYTFNSSSGIHNYFFTNSGLSFSSLSFDFKEKLTSTKTYSIVSGSNYYPSTSNEVYISLVTSSIVNYNPKVSGNTLTITANVDGSFSFAFSNVGATGLDFNLTSHTKNISGSAKFKENAPVL